MVADLRGHVGKPEGADPAGWSCGEREPLWRQGLPVLESPRVRLRELEPRDTPSLLEAMSSYEVTRYLSPGPATLEEFEAFVAWAARARAAGQYLTFGVVPVGRDLAAGIFQIWPIEPGFTAAEWGFALAQPFWGTGLFWEAARLLIDFAIEVLGVQRLESRAAAENLRGNAALRKLGAVREGVLRKCFWCDGSYRDHVMWSILLEDWQRLKISRQIAGADRSGCSELSPPPASGWSGETFVLHEPPRR